MTTDEQARLVDALESLIVSAVGLTTAVLESCAPAEDITLQQWRALAVVARQDGIRTGELARRVGMAVPSTSRLVRRLERRGLALPVRDESDRRATLVYPTEEGRALWATLVDRRRALIAELLADLESPLSDGAAADIEALRGAFARFS